MVGSSLALVDHAKGADLLADRWHCGGADDLVAGKDRRQPQLGLPVLLGARRDAHAAGLDGVRIFSGGKRLA